MAELGDWNRDVSSQHPADWLEERLGPDTWGLFVSRYAGKVWRVPHSPYYETRNAKIRKAYAAMRAKGVRYRDAVYYLAREYCLSSKRIESIVATTS